MIAIQKASGGFSDRWINYCEGNDIPYKIVDCYRNDILDQINGCQALLWQFYQGAIKDHLMAKALMNALEHAGVKTFPDFATAWHFDDKVGQKYLLEAIKAPVPDSWVFYNKSDALKWLCEAEFPIVFKLRGGAGSQNVSLVRTKRKAKRLIRKAFGQGIPIYWAVSQLKERLRLYKLKKINITEVFEGLIRLFIDTPYSRFRGREKGYIYFQEFITGNDSDTRVVIIDNKAFAIKRMVREGDFRASGSGSIMYDKELIDEKLVKLSFEVAGKLKAQCLAFDYVYKDNKPLIVEMSYGFAPAGYDPCPGYWDKELNWHEGHFNPYGWMVQELLKTS